jgi:hypothetical protein
MKDVVSCDVYVQRKGALEKLAKWFVSVKKRKKEMECNFLKNKNQGE